MQVFIYFMATVFGLIAGIFLAKKFNFVSKGRERFSLALAREARVKKKEEAKRKILELFSKNERITNNDVEELFGVSHATATNYLSELEKEGKIIQQGDAGRGVFYILIND